MATTGNGLETLLKFFATGTTEGESDILQKAYIRDDNFIEYITPTAGSPRIILGKKGSGKTAVIDYAKKFLSECGSMSDVVSPSDLDITFDKNDDSVGANTKASYAAITKAIALRIGNKLKGYVNENDKKILEMARDSGTASFDLISAIASIATKAGTIWTGKQLDYALKNAVPKNAELVAAISTHLKSNKISYYLFIDDTDQVADLRSPTHLNRIWGFLLAARKLAMNVNNISIILTIRDEVWRRLTRDNAGQRDQADHFKLLIRHLNPQRNDICAIIRRRLELAVEVMNRDVIDLYGPFFENQTAKMKDTDEPRTWEDIITVRSRERPRDAIQMIASLAKYAIGQNKPKILDEHLRIVMPDFSKERVNLLSQECEYECPTLPLVIASFAKMDFDEGKYISTADNLLSFLNKIPTMHSVTLYGITLRADPLNAKESSFAIWRYLYDIGVINARVTDNTTRLGFRHIGPFDDPTLVSIANWNKLQSMLWEMNPAYRDFIDKIRDDAQQSTGLATRSKLRKDSKGKKHRNR